MSDLSSPSPITALRPSAGYDGETWEVIPYDSDALQVELADFPDVVVVVVEPSTSPTGTSTRSW